MPQLPMRSCTFCLLLLLPGLAGAVVHSVPGEYDTIQEALDACSPGDTVSVAPGIYTGPGNRELALTATPVVLTSEAGAQQTAIDCEFEARAIVVVSPADGTTIIRGFTFTRATPAVRVRYAQPRFLDCIFLLNASGDGGAVIIDTGGQPVFRGCEFRENAASYDGGAIECSFSGAVLSDCVFTENTAAFGGAVNIHLAPGTPDLVIRGCEFAGNSAAWCGGAVNAEDFVDGVAPGAAAGSYAPVEVADCLFDNNSASGATSSASLGGGVCAPSPGVASVSGRTFKGNSADWGGGLAFGGVMTDCLVFGNEAGELGGGVLFGAGEMENCTIVQNVAPEGAGIYAFSSSKIMRSSVLAWNCPGAAITLV